MSLKIVTWNVNGIRSRIFNHEINNKLKKNHIFIPEENSSMSNLLKKNPDIICLQETRTDKEINLSGFISYFNHSKSDKSGRAGNRYSGTVIYTKIKPNNVIYTIPGYEDQEGRIIVLYFDNFILINVYTPNSGTNYDNRMIWNKAFLNFLTTVKCEVIFCGDLNVAYRSEDIHFNYKNSSTYKKKTDGIVGYLPEEREFIDLLLEMNYKDCYLECNKELYNDPSDFQGFTWWDPRTKKIKNEETGIEINAFRYKNYGWRLDYIITSNHIKILNCKVLKNIGEEYSPQGSDHAPVLCELII